MRRLLIAALAAAAVPAPALADPSYDAWAPTGSMTTPRWEATAALLHNGEVFVAGGQAASGSDPVATDVYDPASGKWTMGPNLSSPRVTASSVTLNSGAVLIVGGQASTSSSSAENTAEIYDPNTNLLTPLSSTMSSARSGFPAAVLLGNGDVLIAGGLDTSGNPVASADIFDPTTNAFTPAAPMTTPRADPTATLLQNGSVLVAGGSSAGSPPTATATGEVYDPGANTWTAVSNSMSTARVSGAAALLPGGKVLEVGGFTSVTLSTPSADIYDPAANAFTPGPPMHSSRVLFGIAPLPGGRVLVAGGAEFMSGVALNASSETYDPAANGWTSAGGMITAPLGPTMTALSDGRVLIAGGSFDGVNGSTPAAIFTPATIPGAPATVTATPGNGSAVVDFAPPASDGGSPVEHYTITASTGQTATTPDGRTTATVTGLRNGTAVTFTVTATNAIGTGPASGSAAVIPGPPTVKLSGPKTHVRLRAFFKGVKFSVTPNKAASFVITLLGSTNRATISRAYNLALASKRLSLSALSRAVTLKPSKKLVGHPRRARVQLQVVATDAYGETSTTTVTIRVRR